jgi:deazaflavin-dependent oxidoreductase (nitroreductase family)
MNTPVDSIQPADNKFLNISISEDQLRRYFKVFNRFMVFIWRLGFGYFFNGTTFAGNIMVLKHHGRQSQKPYLTPVNFVQQDGDVFCMAGFGEKSDWFLNLLANPQVEIWLPEERWSGKADILDGAENSLLILRQLIIASGFAAPAFGVHLDRMTDQDLAKLLDTYRLVRIRRLSPLTGSGGPGDLAWIWPYTTLVLLVMLIFRRKRR